MLGKPQGKMPHLFFERYAEGPRQPNAGLSWRAHAVLSVGFHPGDGRLAQKVALAWTQEQEHPANALARNIFPQGGSRAESPTRGRTQRIRLSLYTPFVASWLPAAKVGSVVVRTLALLEP